MLPFVSRRLLSALAVLLLITFTSYLAQDIAFRTRTNQPSPLLEVASEAASDSFGLWRSILNGDLGSYASTSGAYGATRVAKLVDVLDELFLRSSAILALAMILGGVAGGLIGVLAAATRRRGASLLLILLSIVGISTPSFFLGMLLQYAEILAYRTTGLRLLPVGGFGWDYHLVLPVLVLAARPIAQVARLTNVRVASILQEDFVRTARAKGLPRKAVWLTHVVPNASVSVLTAMGTSLRFSLSSLPVVEFLFGWPGIGKAMLEMLQSYQSDGATVVVLTMGAVVVGVNLLLDVAYRVLDPRMRQGESQLRGDVSWTAWARALLRGLWQALLLQRMRERPESMDSLPAALDSDGELGGRGEPFSLMRTVRSLRVMLQSPAMVLGLVLGSILMVLVVAGPSMAIHNPYTSSATLMVDGKHVVPPLSPSPTYPLGTDAQGRDILSPILAGARRTISIAVFAVVARLVVGGTLGFLAGWFPGSRLDRTIMGLSEALSAFPSLLLAMLIVYAAGIRQGLASFVIALAIIGWSEVMQTVRTQVMSIKPMSYVESAVATGLSEGRILTAHVLPNVWPTMVSLAFLEMGGVLMILGELGFLGVFIGGGLAGDGDGIPTRVYYDIPEWSVMLANAWRSFRSYPWASIYPALAFFLSILGFAYLGEGFRWLSERLTLSMRSLFNRYTLVVAAVIVFGANRMLQSTSLLWELCRGAKGFDATRALSDVRLLASDEFNGRLSGSEDAERAAEWLAAEFESLGLLPAGEALDSYYYPQIAYYRDLVGMPSLTLTAPDGSVIEAEYGVDFWRQNDAYDVGGIGTGEVVFVASSTRFTQSSTQAAAALGLSLDEFRRTDRVLLNLAESGYSWGGAIGRSGVLMPSSAQPPTRYELLANSPRSVDDSVPEVYISEQLADRIVALSGQALADIESRLPLARDESGMYLPMDWVAELSLPAENRKAITVRHVMGIWPGEDVVMDNDLIIVSAYYDGLGRLPDGTLYPGANDNASGVASMLEMIRLLKEHDFKPKRTIMFVAWVGGERHQVVDYGRFMKARSGYEVGYRIIAGLEMEGVGAGSGDSAAAWHSSRERLTEVLQKSARKVGTKLDTIAAGLHADPALWPEPSKEFPSAVISWAGADDLAHLPSDSIEAIDPDKLEQVGRMTSLAVMYLASDPSY